MGIQEHNKSRDPISFTIPNNLMHLDIETSSTSGSQAKEHGLLREEFAPKVRKPYTITKQRERWTEEEHRKFLEALQLYGRVWRRIEEHIGTKTAVQIRSHAQKFFSKVVRESASHDKGNIKPIEIPPPRPKRKPMHPYPRKMGNFSTSEGLTMSKLGISSSLTLSPSENENGSPTSVLSSFGSDTMSSFLSNLSNHCTSLPVTSAAESNKQDASTEELNLHCGGNATSKEDSSKDEPAPYLKLFGTTVVPNTKALPNAKIERQDKSSYMDIGSPASNGDFLGLGKGTLRPWFYSLPSTYEDAMNPIEPRIPLPWSALYGNSPLSFLHHQNASSTRFMSQYFVGASSEKVMRKEFSFIVSNTMSSKCAENGVDVSKDNASLGNKRGFVPPYKRCVVERREDNSQRMGDDGEDQSLGLCL